MLYQSEGVVLDQNDLGETDKLATIFTLESGLVRAVVKGGARPNSKLRGLTQPFTYGLFELFRGRTFDRVIQVSVKDSFPLIMEDYEKMVYARYVAELFMTVLPERAKEKGQFEFLLAVLRCLEEKGDPWIVARWAELGVLSIAGFAPAFSGCVLCGESTPDMPSYFSLQNGGILCADCIERSGSRAEDPGVSQERTYGEILKLSPGTLRTLQILSSYAFSVQTRSQDFRCPRVNAVGQVRDEITMLMRRYVSFVLEKRLKSAELIESIEDSRG